ncbi:MAG: HDOD domain-containing protein [Nitrospiraceae bacterium]|nr:HDOD domain-containing protein [Nitrospiraceae bacterium]
MKKVTGDTGLMTLPDVMQWAETTGKTGSLSIRRKDVSKIFYIQDGKIIFVSSQKPGERLGEYFSEIGHVRPADIEKALRESKRLGVPFTGYLVSEGVIEQKKLESLIEALAEKIFTDALRWDDGIFEFTDVIPALIVNGPIKLSISFVVFQSVKQYDETNKGTAPDATDVLLELSNQISTGNIDIPPAPLIMHKLDEVMQREDFSIQEIVKIIMSDQILTSKVLRVVNSAFYSSQSEITSLQQAIIFMGLKSILSIVAVHSLSGFAPRSPERIREILRHSLVCAFVAKKIASSAGIDPEEAFVCGLLHDIGKTVLLNFLSDHALPDDAKGKIIREFHQEVGFLLADTWKFSDVVKHAIKFHHNPELVTGFRKNVATIYIADLISNGRYTEGCLQGDMRIVSDERLQEIVDELETVRETVSSLI